MNFSIKRALVAVVAFFSVATLSLAQQPEMPKIPVDPNVRIGKLDNGLTYYIRHNAWPAKQAEFYIAQRVGSILEEENQRGLAHFLEHMCFNGTTHFPDNTLREYLESIGVKFGADLNAYTSVDETVYNISRVPVIREGIIDSCLLILHDWANDLTLDGKEIDKERGVIHEEWRSRTGAMMRMYEQVFPQLFPNSKYGVRLPIGIMEVVDNFPHQALRDYYEKWYRPDLQGIIVVGDVDVDQIEKKIKALFGPIKMPANPAERTFEEVADNDAPIFSVAKDREQQRSMFQIFFKHDAVKPEQKNTIDYLIQNYAISMISTMLNTRLEELSQKADAPFLAAGVGDGDFILAKTKAAFYAVGLTKDDAILTGMEAIYREVLRAQQFGFTASEYERTRADYLSGLEQSYNERNKTKSSSYVNEYVRHFLDNEPIPGIENEYALMTQYAPMIPLEVMNMAIKQLVTDKNMVVAVFCPEKEGMTYPTEAQLADVLAKVKAEKLTAYEDKVSNEPLISQEPKAGKIVKTEKGMYGSTIWTLSNGVKVVIKKTDFKADQITMNALSRGGTSLFDDKDALQIQYLNSVSGLGGLGNFSAIDLGKALAGKVASASSYVGTLSEGINGSCSPKYFETMMQLTYLSFTAPRMDQEAFTSFITRTKSQLKNQALNPMKALQDSVTIMMYGKHPRVLNVKEEMMDQVNYARIMEMYKDRFADASDFTFFLVGNIDEEAIKPYVCKYLASLPNIKRKEDFIDRKVDIRKGVHINHFTRQMETAKSTVFMYYSGNMAYNLKNNLMMDMFEQLMDILYTKTVREEAGGTYGVHSSGSIEKYPKETFGFNIIFETDPARLEEMIKLIKEGADQFIKEGPLAEDLSKVKEFMLKQHEANQKENSYWMSRLTNYYWEGLDADTDYVKTVNSITAEDLKAFAKSLFEQNNEIEVSMSAPKQ